MMSPRKLAALIILAAVVAPAHAQERNIFGDLLKAITKPPANAQRTDTQPAPAAPGTGLGRQTEHVATLLPEQSAKLKSLLALPQSDRALQKDIAENAELITQLVETQACATHAAAYRRFNPLSMRPRNFESRDSGGRAMTYWRYHNTSRCASVLRFKDWKRLSANAFSFGVEYISDQSQEVSTSHGFELQKDIDGRWLIKWFG